MYIVEYKYDYKYGNKIVKNADSDNGKHFMTVHKNKMDIFNYSRKPGGNNPEIGKVMTSTFDMRTNKEFKDILTKGSLIEFAKRKDKDDQVLTYARHLNGKTLLVIMNLNKNRRSSAEISVPGIKDGQPMKNLVKNYGEKSFIQVDDDKVKVDLGPARAHVYMINTPNIENDRKGHVYVQNFTNNVDAKNPKVNEKKGEHLSLKK
jgi:hypothetical protein